MVVSRPVTLVFAGLFGFLVALPQTARADTEIQLTDTPSRTLTFTGLIGGSYGPGYPGDPNSEAALDLRFGFLSYRSSTFNYGEVEDTGADPFARSNGPVAGLAFGFQAARKASDYPELDGLNDIDTSIEVGFGVGYRWTNVEVLAAARYGLTGHQSFVGDVIAYYVARPADKLTVRVGPRIELASDKFARTYFGVTEDEAAASAFSAFAPSGGISRAGLEVIATYEMADDWWLEFRANWDRFMGDAADSPIVQQGSREQAKIRLGVRRAFRLRF